MIIAAAWDVQEKTEITHYITYMSALHKKRKKNGYPIDRNKINMNEYI